MIPELTAIFVIIAMLFGGVWLWRKAMRMPNDAGCALGAAGCTSMMLICGALIVSPFVASPIVNEIFLYRFAKYVETIPPPTGATVISVKRTYGNYWNGNSCGFLIYVKLKTDMPEARTRAYYESQLRTFPSKYADTEVDTTFSADPLEAERQRLRKNEQLVTFLISTDPGVDLTCH